MKAEVIGALGVGGGESQPQVPYWLSHERGAVGQDWLLYRKALEVRQIVGYLWLIIWKDKIKL